VVLLPTNPVASQPPLEPIAASPQWLSVLPQSVSLSHCSSQQPSSVLSDPHLATHLPGQVATQTMMKDPCSFIVAAQTEYDAKIVAVLETAPSSVPPPCSSATLPLMNVFKLVEINTAPQFEQAVASMTPEEQLDCGVLYFLECNSTIDISDLPFDPSSHPDSASCFLDNLPASLAPPPMSTLPSKRVLSVPEYLDGIQDTLDALDFM
jgi:hypothetical protein